MQFGLLGGSTFVADKKILVDGQLRKKTINLAKVYIIVGGFFGTVENVPFTKRSLRQDDYVKKII
uniref:Uncharacterized protein n=1 Tax=Triticum urartu TaxID=4572 RepID=A0A8R7QU79_TRIUA